MAEGVRLRFGSSIGIASSGVAGPDGGSEEKPVGTIWIGYSDARGSFGKKLLLTKDRLLNIQMTKNFLLNWVRTKLVE
jgi:nicotinamide-nucleotide amidase